MLDQSLLNYIKQTRGQGFPETDIRTALLGAGWDADDVAEAFALLKPKPQVAKLMGQPAGAIVPATTHLPVPEGFFHQYGKALATTLSVLILLPALAYGGYVGYQKLNNRPTEVVAGQHISSAETAADGRTAEERDTQRIKDIGTLQKALAAFYELHRVYPKGLNMLTVGGTIKSVPKDPKSRQNYLYNSLGDPALYYDLTFILEAGSGSLGAGLHQVSSDDRAAAGTVARQDEAVRGLTVADGALQITDLSKKPFYAQEEVTLEVSSKVELVKTSLTLDSLKLTDHAAPFEFHFTAPKKAGKYDVKIFGFDKDGATYSAATTLTVR